MPNKASAKKELRKSKKRILVNTKIKANLKDLTKKSRKALNTKQAEAKTLITSTIKALDKAAGKGKIKKNTASRTKSRLMKQLNKTTKK
jgi:small subunit ribosomal protein S20